VRTTKRTVAVLAGSSLTLLSAATAAAAATYPTPYLSQHSVNIFNNYDTSSNGIWAKLNTKRTVKILKVPGSTNKYVVTLTDDGTLTTIPGKKSPGNSAITLQRAVTGTFEGSFTFDVTSNTGPVAPAHSYYNYMCNVNGSGDRSTDCPGMPAETSAWPKVYFGGNATVMGRNSSWHWTYQAKDCSGHTEVWTTQASGDHGNILAKACGHDDHGHGNDHGHDDHGNDHGHNHGDDHGHHAPKVTKVYAKSPLLRQPTCFYKYGVLTVPFSKSVSYYNKDHKLSPTTKLNPGTYHITAKAAHGYQIVGNDDWYETVRSAAHCLPTHHSHH
jgi:hypothetical protein